MGSFKRNGRNQGPDRRRGVKGQRRRGFPRVESLENRVLLDGGVHGWKPTSTDLADVRNGPMANEGQTLINVYQDFLKTGDASKFASSFPELRFQGNNVGISVNGTGDFNSFLTSLKNLGMQVSASSAKYEIAVGMAPISALPAIAELPQTLDATPNYKPITHFQGVANNEADAAMKADVARTQFGLTGAGVTVGVLSDSVSQFQGGLADSVKTGDLPNNVKVIQDGPAGSTDEGRAMLENIHDIAPGAALQFATADPSELAFNQNILALAASGSKIINDDVRYLDEPYFQDGLVSQAVDQVTQNGASYFSSAGNESDSGYLSNFRAVSTTVGSLGAGTYMNFNPGAGAAVAQLPITIPAVARNGAPIGANNPAEIWFQFDQPFATQQPAGTTAAPTSEVDFYILDANGAIVASSTNNNVATREPVQSVEVTTSGNFFVVMKVVSGPNPGHVEFINFNESTDTTVSHQFGSAGGTFYPTTSGHASAIATIGVGAVPWWAPAPFLNTNPLNNEYFSSFGPAWSVFNVDGTPKSSPVLVQAPVVSGADGGNTSFFGFTVDTSKPPFPGQPATATNLSQNLPSFFGTSSATPNVAAVAALMLQRVPSLSPAGIRAGLIASAQPLNGATQGSWNVQGGFGYVNAVAAINAVDVLRVSATVPANGATVTTAPTGIIVTFNKPVQFSTVTSADLAFLSVPSAVTGMKTLTPIAVDDPVHPTIVDFPFVFTVATNKVANGTFTYAIQNPPGGPTVLSFEGPTTAGKPLQPFNGSFAIADRIAPRVSNVTVNGRIVTVQFNEPMNPATINASTIFLARVDAPGKVFNLNSDPRFKISYNTATNTATLDYSGLDQIQFPSAVYTLTVLAGNANPLGGFFPGVTDVVGNKLDGEFSGVFPSGDGDPPTPTNPSGRSADENFYDSLGFQQLKAPVITSLSLLPQFDTGIKGDENTNNNMPSFVGQVFAAFPGTLGGLTVLAQFNALNGGNLDLAPVNGRGSMGTVNVQVTTDSTGRFVLPAPFLPEGFNRVRLVVVGQPEAPPLAGLSSSFEHAFRIDKTAPTIVSAALTPGAATLPLGNTSTPLATLTTMSLNVVDPANPTLGFLATPAAVLFPALDPATASNISNYSLINLDDTADPDKSRFISTATFTATASNFVSPPARKTPADPYFGRVDLTFSQGLTAGHYELIAHTKEGIYNGVTDAAGNPLDNTSVPGQGSPDFILRLLIQPQPVFITSVFTDQPNAQGNNLLPRSYYEVNPRTGDIVSAPPTTFTVDFSNPLDPAKSYADSLQLIASQNGDFGTLGEAGLGSSGATRINPAGTTVTLMNGPNGTNTRLVMKIPAGTLTPNHYRFYIPNTGADAIFDIYGNQLDGEFLGNPATSGVDANGNPNYEDLLPNGQYRMGMSGDSVAGGAFMTGFVVVPTGNVVYARPDYVEDPLLASTTPDGSLAKPYPVLAPQAAPNALNSSTLNNGDPNGGLNSSVNFLSGFNPIYDRAGIGRFARSAFYAASQLSSKGPVVIVALPGTPQTDPITGKVSQQTFVLQAPAGSDPVINDGSGSVPFNTTLVFNSGSTLKLENASLFAQNQGSAIQALGGPNPNQRVNFTSYANDAIAGDTNHDGNNTTPRAGDWGGIVYRNFDQSAHSAGHTFPVDVTLTQGPNGALAVSGEDDALSTLNFANISFGGGAVPATRGTRYDEVTLYNSRPAITNDTITGGPQGGSQAAISGDLDSFREDDTARGPLVRRTTVAQTSINGIWVRPLSSTGVAEATDAIPYPDNPVTLGGVRNYTFDAPLPYVLTAVLDIGTENLVDNLGMTDSVFNRLYIQPGMMIKSEPGSGIRVLTAGASLIVGDRTYISRWDAQASIDPISGLPTSPYSPQDPNFKPNATGDARVLFTTAFDNTATTQFFDPLTQQSTTIVPAIDTLNTKGVGQPTPGNVPDPSRWGRLQLDTGAFGILDEADIRYAGGPLNVPGGTNNDDGAVQLTGAAFLGFIPGQGFVSQDKGTRFIITNNNFTDNKNVGVSITPNGLLAGDTLRPLSSGVPFFRGNIFQRNPEGNGLLVEGQTGKGSRQVENDDVNSLWDSTDLTYILKGTVVMGPSAFALPPSLLPPNPTSLLPEPKPSVVLTVQSALAGTLLANGQTIPRPGEPVIIKLLPTPDQPPYTLAQTQAPTISTEDYAGSGFIAGVDNGVDPTTDPFFDVGVYSQMRFLGIGGNETTGQQRVPVIITSVHDSTVGTTVRGVKMFTAIDGDTTAPAPGDGGVIYFGGNELPNYNILDPRAGSLIDNADIRYLTRIEMQGGGVINYEDLNASNSFDAPDDPYAQKGGAFPPLPNGSPDPLTFGVQFNAEHALMISNSNLSSFSDTGVAEHPGFNQLVLGPGTTPRSGVAGEPNLLFMMNNTITNMPVAVNVVGDPHSDTTGQSPEPNEFLALHNTFYNDPIGVILNAIVYAPGTPQFLAQIHFIAMDNIFDGSTTNVIQAGGMDDGSLMQFNLFFNDGPIQVQLPGGAPVSHIIPNDGAIIGKDPLFRDPANGNFQLQPNSPAIDAARSELNLNPDTAPQNVIPTADTSTTLIPVVNQVLDVRGGIRNQTIRVPITFLKQFDPANPPPDFLRLPGSTDVNQIDEWVATLPSDPQAIPGPDTVPGAWEYKPALIPPGTNGVPGGGERDQLGFLRQDDPNVPNTGFGAKPFFDIGAFEFRPLFPPHVTGVTATVTDPNNPPTGVSTINLYAVGSFAGTNKPVQTINVQFDHSLDPTTVTGDTVLLEASGGDGIFGNNNNPNDKFYNLSGKVSFNSTTNVLTVNVGAAGLVLQDDEYRLFLLGTGTNVLRDPQGNALDGENTQNDDPNNPQLPLPSGDGFPGGNFYDTFIVNTKPATVKAGTLTLDPSSDTNIVGDKITLINKPGFSGNIMLPLAGIEPLAGQTVILDISTKGDGVFDRLNAGTALTDATGHFLVTVGADGASTGLVTNTSPLPDSPYSVGPDGKLNPLDGDDSGYTWARVRIIDVSGNASNQPTDPLSSFIANNALTGAVIDTAPPKITAFSPTPNTSIAEDATGKIKFTFTTDKNIDPASLNGSTILVTRGGPDGILGTKDDVSVPIDSNSITTKYLATTSKGPEQISFTISGSLPNDIYEVTLKGAGSTTINTIAGQPLDGLFNGTFPSGQDNVPGSDFNAIYVMAAAGSSHNDFVGPASFVTNPAANVGARANPFPTIGAAIAKAIVGDTIAVLPGVYTENVTLRPFLKLISVSPSSTDTSLVGGNAQQTVIRAPVPSPTSTGLNVTVSGTNLPTIPGIDTEVAGFSIASPLVGDPANGPIDPNSIDVQLVNSNVLLDRNYIVDSHIGVDVVTSPTAMTVPRILNDGIIGNDIGILLQDVGSTSLPQPTSMINNTIAFNTFGLYTVADVTAPLLGNVFNDIFWENHDTTTARGGAGIFSTALNKLLVKNSLFQGNGPSETSPAFAGINVGNGFVAPLLGPTPDGLGNFTGAPAFVAPRDPRPGADGPANFFLDANFDLTKSSAAIDAANNAVAPPTDFLLRGRIRIPGKGFPGTGPADVGAFEFMGTGGIPVGGAFRVSTTSLNANGGVHANGVNFSPQTAPSSITVSFSDNVDASTVAATDLLLVGDGLNPVGPARATSFSWIDAHTVKFNLSGGYSNVGTVQVKIPTGAIKSVNHAPVLGFVDTFKIIPTVSQGAQGPPITPPPAASPTAASASPASTQKGPSKRGFVSRFLGKH
jgi:hypothetical protein